MGKKNLILGLTSIFNVLQSAKVISKITVVESQLPLLA